MMNYAQVADCISEQKNISDNFCLCSKEYWNKRTVGFLIDIAPNPAQRGDTHLQHLQETIKKCEFLFEAKAGPLHLYSNRF